MRLCLRLAKLVVFVSVIISAIVSIQVLCNAQTEETPVTAADSELFTDYMTEARIASVSSGFSGIVPEPVDLSHLKTMNTCLAGAVTALPALYDLRTLGKLTAIRDQGACGSCWTFATMASIESFLLPTETWNFSENNLKNTHGFDLGHSAGGNRSMATAYLARWSGPVAEADDPYNPSSGTSPANLSVKKHVQDVIYVPDRNSSLDNNNIKQAIMTYGAVYSSYYHDDSYYDPSNSSYCYSGGSGSNHAICLVGWDDNFDKNSFCSPAPGNGAFIARNSWGQFWGDSGYYYISYYDTQIGGENAVFTAEATTGYTGIFQYDTLGWTTSSGYGTNTAWFANIFTASSNCSLAAASWYSATPDANYEMYVYVSPTSGPVGSSAAATKTGTIATAGYHTVKLDTPVALTSGQKFSIVIKLTTPGYNYPIPLERPLSGYCSHSTASAGQSYMSSNGSSWSDVTTNYANTNVCLKAFASGATAPTPDTPAGVLTVTPTTAYLPNGQVGGPFAPTSQVVTLKNTGNASLDWTATNTKQWLTLSCASGTLTPGTSKTVTISIGTATKTMAAGTYDDTISFTNTTNGKGNATKPVTLTVNNRYTLDVSPSTSLSTSGPAGGPFTPTSAVYAITNTGTASVGWTASVNQPWLTVSSASGTLSVDQTTRVTVYLNALAKTLTAKSYSATVTFKNDRTGTTYSRVVSLVVKAAAIKCVASNFSWIDPTQHTSLELGDDAAACKIPLPFAFQFYGKNYTTVDVGSNGLVGFTGTSITSFVNSTLPQTATPNALVCPYWDDLDPSHGGSVRMGTVGTAPNRKVVISWVGVTFYEARASTVTFQVLLCEGTNDIVFQYLNVAPTYAAHGRGASATIGVEDSTGATGKLYSFNKAGAVSNSQAICFSTRL